MYIVIEEKRENQQFTKKKVLNLTIQDHKMMVDHMMTIVDHVIHNQ